MSGKSFTEVETVEGNWENLVVKDKEDMLGLINNCVKNKESATIPTALPSNEVRDILNSLHDKHLYKNEDEFLYFEKFANIVFDQGEKGLVDAIIGDFFCIFSLSKEPFLYKLSKIKHYAEVNGVEAMAIYKTGGNFTKSEKAVVDIIENSTGLSVIRIHSSS